MTTGLYLMYDSVSGQSGPVFEAENDAVIDRMFANLAKDDSVPDYALRDTVVCYLGMIDRSDPFNPRIDACPIPRPVLKGCDYPIESIRQGYASAVASTLSGAGND